MKKKIRIFLLSSLGFVVLRLFSLTMRFKFEVHPSASEWVGNKPLILAFWHNRQLMMPWCYLLRKSKESKKMYTLISEHSDGRIISAIIDNLGIRTVSGSSSSGGRRALSEMVKIIRNGQSCAITPDGPRGPKYKLKEGVILLAKLTSAPIYPASFSAKNCWVFKSWDNMFIPKPFSEVHFYIGQPLLVPADVSNEDFQSLTQSLESQMLEESRLLDEKIYGRLI